LTVPDGRATVGADKRPPLPNVVIFLGPTRLDDYPTSRCYLADLDAVGQVWDPGTVRTAGVFVFLTYLSLPTLLAVRSRAGSMARSFLDGTREKAFLQRILGTDVSPPWRGGIGNRRVMLLAKDLGERHRLFPGMRQEYLDLMAAVIAMAPVRVHDAGARPIESAVRRRYWRYMTLALGAVGASLPAPARADRRCRAFTARHGRCTSEGARLLDSLRHRHPEHLAAAIPALHERTRAVVHELSEGLPHG
jgi:hypothetical protein